MTFAMDFKQVKQRKDLELCEALGMRYIGIPYVGRLYGKLTWIVCPL